LATEEREGAGSSEEKWRGHAAGPERQILNVLAGGGAEGMLNPNGGDHLGDNGGEELNPSSAVKATRFRE